MNIVEIAERIARETHKDQLDKSGLPYILHPQRVAHSFDDPELQAAAWLHDVIEDHHVQEGYLSDQGIPDDVIRIVKIVSRQRHETYAMFIDRIAESNNMGAVKVKLADLYDNLRPGCPPDMLENRYKPAIEKLERIKHR